MIDIRSFRDLLRLFYIFRREFLIAFGLTVLFAVGIAFLMPPKYASEARLLVKPGRENLTVPLDAGRSPSAIPSSTKKKCSPAGP